MKRQLSITLDERTATQLDALPRSVIKSRSSFINRLIDEWLKKREEETTEGGDDGNNGDES